MTKLKLNGTTEPKPVIPGEVAFALETNRPELLKLFKPRALTVDECAGFLVAIESLIEHRQKYATLTQRLRFELAAANRKLDAIGAALSKGDDE